MEINTKTRTYQILTVMRVLAWVAYIGVSINAGAIIISYVASIFNAEAAKDLYKGLDLYNLKETNFWHYTGSVSFMVALLIMKAYVCSLVIKVLSEVNLTNPFTTAVARNIEKISYVLLEIWVIGLLSNANAKWLLKRIGDVHSEWTSSEFIFLAGLVFVLAQIFKRGVEIQSENDLTV